MTFFRVLSAAIVGVSALSAGCIAGSDDLGAPEALDRDAPSLSSMGGFHGAGGTNKLNPAAFHANKWTLFAATKAPLATYNSTSKSWSFANNSNVNALLGTTDGRDVLKYAVQCSLSSAVTVRGQAPDGTAIAYTGQDILATTSNWKTAALNIEQAEALFTCMIAHLNALGAQVPINLSGIQVINHMAGYDPAFSWEEALWAVKIFDSGDPTDVTFNLYGWAMDNLLACGESVTGITSRICAQDEDTCGLTVRNDLNSACTFSDDVWYCNDLSGHPLPTIMTKLKAADVSSIYSDCGP